jgi:predicted kinase
MFFLQMSGFPGSGKSTLAREIGKRTGAVVIDHDVVKSAFVESSESVEIDARLAGGISYSIEWSLIDSLLSQGHSVIFDSPCFYTEMVEKGVFLSDKHTAKYKYVECYVDDMEEINKRLKQRERLISQIEYVESEQLFIRSIQNSKKPEHHHIRVHSNQPIECYIHEALEYIEE